MMSTNPLSFITLAQRLKQDPEVWASMAWQLVCEMRVALPCIVKSFDPVKQTITAQPVIQENILQDLVITPVDLPILVDIPISVPRGGAYALTLPVQEGDECLVIFADMCYNAWYTAGGEKNAQETKRRHDLSDGFAILGPWSQPRVLQNYSETTVQLRNEAGDTLLEIDGTTINIVAPDGGAVNLTAAGSGKVVITSDTEVDITAPIVKINGSTLVDIAGGNSKVDGKVFLTHKHSGVQTGGGNTGNVV